jgi:hypothetical protein
MIGKLFQRVSEAPTNPHAKAGNNRQIDAGAGPGGAL